MTEWKMRGALKRLLRIGAACALLALAGAAAVQAQDYPSRPVTVVVPFSAGGNTDTMARLLADFLSRKFGQNFVVENQPTAGGVVGTQAVVNASADGHYLLFGAAPSLIIRPLLQPLEYGPDDLAPVSALGVGPFILGIRKELGPTTLEEFIAYGKDNPGQINYASGGTGGIGHLSMAMLAAQAGVDMVEIPYPGGAPASAALMAGEVDAYFGNASEMLRMAADPNILLIAVSSPERIEQMPDMPAVAEIIPGFVTNSWNGLLAPVGTPPEIIAALAKGTIEAANDPTISGQLLDLGILPLGTTTEELGDLIENDKTFYTEAVAVAGLEMN
jgi:tripartite-type tricarboxylate transporter receptor subunit TctC